MPLVRISVATGTSAEVKQQLSAAVHSGLTDTFNVPQNDLFQLISEHAVEELVCAPEYLGIAHAANVAMIQITCNEGRTVEMKQALYRHIAGRVAATTNIAQADVIISLVEVKKENWSFGNGIAQYA